MAFSQLNGINFAQGNTAASQSGQKTPLKMMFVNYVSSPNFFVTTVLHENVCFDNLRNLEFEVNKK